VWISTLGSAPPRSSTAGGEDSAYIAAQASKNGLLYILIANGTARASLKNAGADRERRVLAKHPWPTPSRHRLREAVAPVFLQLWRTTFPSTQLARGVFFSSGAGLPPPGPTRVRLARYQRRCELQPDFLLPHTSLLYVACTCDSPPCMTRRRLLLRYDPTTGDLCAANLEGYGQPASVVTSATRVCRQGQCFRVLLRVLREDGDLLWSSIPALAVPLRRRVSLGNGEQFVTVASVRQLGRRGGALVGARPPSSSVRIQTSWKTARLLTGVAALMCDHRRRFRYGRTLIVYGYAPGDQHRIQMNAEAGKTATATRT